MKVNISQKLRDVATTMFPSSKVEWSVFAIATIIYGALASFIALNYRIIFDNRIPWDAYFSFDNRAIVMTGGGYERHPLANYFFDFLRSIALAVSNGKMDAYFRLAFALFSTLAISLTLVHVYKYLRNIIALPVYLCCFIVGFFSLFSTNILLSFTPETYTYTLLALMMFNYYAAKNLKNKKKISGSALILGGIAIGGLTITNIVKIYIPLLFENNTFKKWKAFGNATVRCLLSVGVFLLLYLNRLNFDYQRVLQKSTEQYEKFSQPKVTPIWDMMASWFAGGPILFPSFVLRDYHNAKGFEYKAIFMDTYSSIFAYVFVAVMLIMLLWSYLKNARNPLVHILALSFSVDILIHCVLKFGLHTAYIYGGHYIFVFPLMLGWLFHSFLNHPTVFKSLLSILAVCTVFLAANNIYRMQEFFIFLNRYYQ